MCCLKSGIIIIAAIQWVRFKKIFKSHRQALISHFTHGPWYTVYSRLPGIARALQVSMIEHEKSLFSPWWTVPPRRRSHAEASTLLDPTFSLVTRAMSTRLAVSKSRPIRDTRRPLPTHKVAEAPLSPGSTRGRRTEGKRGRDGERSRWTWRKRGARRESTSCARGWGKHHPLRVKGTCMGARSIRTAASGGFPSSYPSRTRQTTPRYSTAQLSNAATTTRLRHETVDIRLSLGPVLDSSVR